MILHTVKQSPFTDLTLSQALASMGPDDLLLLLENGVLGSATQHAYLAQLSELAEQGRLYLVSADLNARGVTAQFGKEIDYKGFVELVTRAQSSLAW
ncbi:sulfurtransferase complex subunit TusB [Motilimonas sp. KMU-193]|uniref:sulfurtransferase complex subunit TusB n=1 Tax=Motilimonas sp. KMU-193 TaxID=3388668 RepID=UPI00396AFEE6